MIGLFISHTVEPLFTYSIGKNGCTYCKKYLNQGMDSHRLTCEVVQMVNDLPQKNANIRQALRITCKGVQLVNDLSQKKFQNIVKT
jgi:hypothetical protein